MQSLTLASLQSSRPCTAISRRGLTSTPLVPLINTRHGHLNAKRSSNSLIVAKGAAPAVPVEAVWEPTGVPLVDELASFSTLQGSAIHAVKLVAIAMAGIYIGSLLVKAISNKADSDDSTSKGLNPINAILGSLAAPATNLLPLYGYIYSATVVSSLVQIFAGKAKAQFNSICLGNGPKVLEVVKKVTQVIQDASEIVFIIAAAWTIVGIKDRIIAFIGRTALKENAPMARLLETVGGLLNYGIYAGAFFSALSTCGINITPLLASLGGASVVIGLASQTILGELASSLTLFAAPPFAAGDSVKFLSGGALVMEGVILAIEPMRTVLKTADGNKLYVQNGKIVTWEVENESRKA